MVLKGGEYYRVGYGPGHKSTLSDSVSILSNSSTAVEEGGPGGPAHAKTRSAGMVEAAPHGPSAYKIGGSAGGGLRVPLHAGCRTMDSRALGDILSADANIVVVDTRPYVEFSKSHVRGALHVCLPSTLLRRKTFSFARLLENLPPGDRESVRERLREHAQGERKLSIVIYDNLPMKGDGWSSLACAGLSAKFLENNWEADGQTAPDVYILSDGYQQFQLQFSELSEALPASAEDDLLCQPPGLCASASSLSTPSSLRGSPLEPLPSPLTTSPMSQLFKFQLPIQRPLQNGNSQALPRVFKMRHFEENSNLESYLGAVDINENRKLSEFDEATESNGTRFQQSFFKFPLKLSFQLEYAKITELYKQDEIDRAIPKWFQDLMLKPSKMQYVEQFQRLDILERTRLDRILNTPFGDKMNSVNTVPCHINDAQFANYFDYDKDYDPQITISSGVELGAKNRYKDVFPYEHTRVVLRRDSELRCTTVPVEKDTSIDTYINANYLTSPFDTDKKCGSAGRYIATQAPLPETIHDFYTCIINNNVPVVLSLTDEFEHGVEKCCKFWADGEYNGIVVSMLEEHRGDVLFIRRIQLTYNEGKSSYELLQIQIKDWPDLGILDSPKDIIDMIFMKDYVVQQLMSNGVFTENKVPTVLVHCSAGCGRTGTLCTVDSVISNLTEIARHSEQWTSNKTPGTGGFDPIVMIIDRFRKQRISMVQTITQYLFIYDCMLRYFKIRLESITEGEGSESNRIGSLVGEQDILGNFIRSKTTAR
ncbi:AaceriACL041Cp [[Ashbya] aceris (nom. inval.)]|nr:AaceriACL041Cp [[Ashbya] aceris (nom. inval.)]